MSFCNYYIEGYYWVSFFFIFGKIMPVARACPSTLSFYIWVKKSSEKSYTKAKHNKNILKNILRKIIRGFCWNLNKN